LKNSIITDDVKEAIEESFRKNGGEHGKSP
jgi:hypothetical protein